MKPAQTTLKTKDWIAAVTAERSLTLQERVVTFLLYAYGFLLAATMTIVFLQGFHVWGFVLDQKVLLWLGGATVGEIGGLLLLTLKAVFRK